MTVEQPAWRSSNWEDGRPGRPGWWRRGGGWALRLGRLVPQLAQDADLVATGSWALEMRQRVLLGLDGVLTEAKAAGLVRRDVDVARFQVGLAQLSRPLPLVVDQLVPGWEDWLVDAYLRGLRP